MSAGLKASPSLVKMDHDGDKAEDIDADNLIGKEEDIREVLRMLSERPNLHLTKEQSAAIEDPKMTTFEKLFTQWNKDMAEHANQGEDEDAKELRDTAQGSLLEKAERGRPRWLNHTLGLAFHLLVLVNFFVAISESYTIVVESAKLDNMFLGGMFQCLQIPKNQNSLLHTVNISYALTCVFVLYARTKRTANLCWLFLVGSTLNACFQFYQVLFYSRFEYDEKQGKETTNPAAILILFILAINIPTMLLVLLRYYDLTQQFVTRAQEFATHTYEGRQLNDKIIYKNVSSFLQRKTVLRSCTSLQIFSTVEKLQAQQRKLKKDEEISDEVVTREVQAAIAALKEVENFRGIEMLRELKRRQYEEKEEIEEDDFEKLENQFTAGYPQEEEPVEEGIISFQRKLSTESV